MKMSPVVTAPTMLPSDTLLVKLDARVDLRAEAKLPRGAERKTAVWNKLVTSAQTSQAPLVELAEQLKASGAIAGYEALVSPNALLIDPAGAKSAEVLKAFAAAQGVASIYDMSANVKWARGGAAAAAQGADVLSGPSSGLDVFDRGAQVDLTTEERPYGLDMIGAPEANAAGADGTGLVYGSIDTGVDATHEALVAKYRGTNADGTQSNDYSWFDFGDKRSPSPKDYDTHGTHTIGTVVGGTDANQIGVAPRAKFISVPGIKPGSGLDVRLKALQFMQAPTRLDGTEANPALAPDVVGMSWWTGPGSSDAFGDSLANLVAAGIEPVKSAGNKGPGPETISAPGQFPTVNAVAAVGPDGQIADFSSRGPSPLPHVASSPLWKPDFAAPGVDTVSSVPGNRYQKMSGTSMAQPHFSGVLLALLTKFPKLTHDQITTVLKESAVDAGARGRDLEFGWGTVNVAKALEVAARTFPGAAA
ncbi:MAG: serine protease [Thermoleophilia bacterium]|nr:serine protease [Thermoleophilia bacterium]